MNQTLHQNLLRVERLQISRGRGLEKVTLVGPISVTLPTRGITVIVGCSGAGKSTFLRAFNRLNDEFPDLQTTGDVFIPHKDNQRELNVNACSLPQLRQQVGMVFQTPHLLPGSIWQNITLPLQILSTQTHQQIAERAEHCLRQTGLWDEVAPRLSAPAQSLSGGQQQRLCLSRALTLQPAILLLDEPTASLDVHATAQIEDVLRQLAQECTLVVVSHSLTQALRLADHLLVLQSGQVVLACSQPMSLSETEVAHLMSASPDSIL